MAKRIATVYQECLPHKSQRNTMDIVRWVQMSCALGHLGYQVDMIVDSGESLIKTTDPVNCVPFERVNWDDYNVVKTLFHHGFQTLLKHGGAGHPFIISKLGSVVGSQERTDGVYFFEEFWAALLDIQRQINCHARYVVTLTKASQELWINEFGKRESTLLVPTGVVSPLPVTRFNPYVGFAEPVVVFIGNFYSQPTQRAVNLLWQRRFNGLGKRLKRKGMRLCVVGPGATDVLNAEYVTYLGSVANQEIINYQSHASVGIVLAQGKTQHNESSKIYDYLAAGLPVVSEQPVPNNHLILAANLGFVAPFDDDDEMVKLICKASTCEWDRSGAMLMMQSHHSWIERARTYQRLLET